MRNDSMFGRLRTRLGANSPGLTVAVVAMLLALTGGAFAAGGGLTSKQKKQVKAIAQTEAKKFQGTGATGAMGPAGANGTNGAPGSPGQSVTGKAISGGACGTGITGVEYTLGAASTPICNGKNGTPGSPGADGVNGQDAGFNYLFNSSTAEADPGTGKLSLNNESAEAATLLWVSETDNNANLLDKVIAGWASSQTTKGTLLVRKAGAPGTFAEYTITGIRLGGSNKDEGTFDKFSVAFVQGNGSFANNDQITVAYFASGSENLPTGPIEMGTWSVTGTTADTGGILVPLTFSTPLPVALESAEVHYEEQAAFETFCKGNSSNPRPEPGNLCVYANPTDGVPANATFGGIFNPSGSIGGANGAGRTGAVLLFSSPTGVVTGSGTFAVRAP